MEIPKCRTTDIFLRWSLKKFGNDTETSTKSMKKIKNLLKLAVSIYGVVCLFLYFFQEKFLFHPRKLTSDYVYQFDGEFEEINFDTEDGEIVNAVHFKVENPKGAVLFLHGNGGTNKSWGEGADLFTDNGYDVLHLDYRGYGKSTGTIMSEQMMVDDAQIAYDYLKERFEEEAIVLSGTSMGTGVASILAGQNAPSKLFLNSPYSSLKALILEKGFLVPPFIIKYGFASITNLEKVKCPIYIFHGSKDRLIPEQHAKDLADKFDNAKLTILEGFGHNVTMLQPPLFKSKVGELLGGE